MSAVTTNTIGQVLATAFTGVGRLTALAACTNGLGMTIELGIRFFTGTLKGMGFKPESDSWVALAGKKISEQGARPYEDENKYPTFDLAVKALAFCAIGIAAFEGMRIIGGPAHPAYNGILSFISPFRLSNQPYLTSAANSLAAARNLFVRA